MRPLKAMQIRAAIMLRTQQEMTMFTRETPATAADVLTDDQLELVSGGDLTVDAGGNIPICPPWFPGHPPGLNPAGGTHSNRG
jgi:hypothetical protein